MKSLKARICCISYQYSTVSKVLIRVGDARFPWGRIIQASTHFQWAFHFCMRSLNHIRSSVLRAQPIGLEIIFQTRLTKVELAAQLMALPKIVTSPSSYPTIGHCLLTNNFLSHHLILPSSICQIPTLLACFPFSENIILSRTHSSPLSALRNFIPYVLQDLDGFCEFHLHLLPMLHA